MRPLTLPYRLPLGFSAENFNPALDLAVAFAFAFALGSGSCGVSGKLCVRKEGRRAEQNFRSFSLDISSAMYASAVSQHENAIE